MLSKCANPECGTAFDDRQGQFFRFHKSQEESDPGANSRAVELFWLCDACRVRYFLEHHESAGVLIRAPLGEQRARGTNNVVAAA